MKSILISGGSGLIGQRLSGLLLDKGYAVMHLSRSNKAAKDKRIKVYQWDVQAGTINQTAIANADAIVHLAGAGVADKRWTAARKKLIVDSRVQGLQLLYKSLQNIPNKVQTFVGASAIGFYGNSGDKWIDEEAGSVPNEFLSTTTQLWEKAAMGIHTHPDIRSVLLRIGIVLTKEGGALPKTAMPVKMGIVSYFGKGNQYYSWIHIDDMCSMFIAALENKKMEGIYNAVAPNPVTSKTFVSTIAKALGRPQILIPAPAFGMRLLLGEMADVVLHGSRVSADKIQAAGFRFSYPELLPALKEIYG